MVNYIRGKVHYAKEEGGLIWFHIYSWHGRGWISISKNIFEYGMKKRLIKELYDDSQPEFSDKWKKFSENNSIFFLDLVKPFQASAKEGKKLFFDHDIHFNRNGCEVVASTIKECYPYLFKHQYQGN